MISPDTNKLLVDAHSNDPLRQVQALIALIKLHDESVTPEILDLLSSADEDVRAESARALLISHNRSCSLQTSNRYPLVTPSAEWKEIKLRMFFFVLKLLERE